MANIKDNKFIKQIPNILTISRIIIAVAVMFLEPYSVLFYVLYAFCGVSDTIDGSIARALKVEGRLGETLDTIGDTLLTWTTTHMVAMYAHTVDGLDCWVGMVIAILVVFASRILGALVTLIRFKKFSMLHTIGNKVGMIIFYLYPFLYIALRNAGAADIGLYVICAFCTLAGIEEVFIELFTPSFDPSIKSIATVIKRRKARVSGVADETHETEDNK